MGFYKIFNRIIFLEILSFKPMRLPDDIQYIILDYLPIEKFLQKNSLTFFPRYVRSVPFEEDCHSLRTQLAAKRQRITKMQSFSADTRSTLNTNPGVIFIFSTCGSLALGLAFEKLFTKFLRPSWWPDSDSGVSTILAQVLFVPLCRFAFNSFDTWTRKRLRALSIKEVSETESLKRMRRRKARK